MTASHAYIGVGSNLGNRQAHLSLAQDELARLPQTQLVAFSPIYETQPVSPIPQGPYLNAAAHLATRLDPFQLFESLYEIERLAGRPPRSQRIKWGPRTLDLDILLYDQQIISSDHLVVPHPLMHERWYVLKPLADLNPNLVHPVLQMTVGDLLKYIETKNPIK